MLKRTSIILTIFLLNFAFFTVMSQSNISKSITVYWSSDPIENNENKLLCPNFLDASYQESFGRIPIYTEVLTIEKCGQKAEVEFFNTIFIPITHEAYLTDFEKNLITNSLQWTKNIYYEKNKTNVVLQIIPYRNNPETGLLEQLYYTDVKISFSDDNQYLAKSAHQAKQYPTKSVLATGDWYKLSVSTSGIYKITGADLKNAGMSISSINPQNLKLYGNGGGMIPEENSKQKYLSLQENAIYVYGEADGVFNESDYILFYGESPNIWEYDNSTSSFSHQINHYSTENYYYIGISDGSGKRIPTEDNSSLVANYTTSVSDYYLFHEEELVNLSKGGKIWFGESFNSINNQQSFTVTIPNIRTSETVKFKTALASSYTSATQFKVTTNSGVVQSVTIPPETNGSSNKTSIYKTTATFFTAPSSSFTLNFSYPNSSGANGWLDYFEIVARRDLVFTSGQIPFCDKNSIAENQITQFSINNASNALTVWDITDQTNIKKMVTALNGSTATFKASTDELKQFVAFDGSSFYSPGIVGKIENQNLTGLRNVQSVIVAYPDFLDLAQTLGERHVSDYGLNTLVVTPQQIYNEFSSGKQDVGAIRDFMRMLYKTADEGYEPKYLLLYGNASYDYKNIKGKNNNLIPTWSSKRSSKAEYTSVNLEYPTDDFFAFLDDDEGGTNWAHTISSYLIGAVDIAVGRFPVRSRNEAEIALDKRLHYTSKNNETKGSWQNIICFVADDQKGYVYDAELLVNLIETTDNNILIDKIYTDAYKEEHAAGGTRYPDAKKALTDRFNNGSLIIDYIGHGSVYGWAEERILEVSDAQSYSNYDHLTFLVTATCTFTRYDDPDAVSAGEYAFLNPNGSAIALFTTSRETGSGNNQLLSRYFYSYLLTQTGSAVPIGYASQKAKHDYALYGAGHSNTQYFILMGDPAMPLAYPQKQVKCTAINNIPIAEYSDTIRSLSKVTISGEIQDENGNKIETFQGNVYPKVFDKQAQLKTLMNDPKYGEIIDFTLWKNMIYNGSGIVKDGSFELSFFVPKDIDYTYDYGRISFFAYDTVDFSDATGSYNDLMLGGINQYADIDTTAPTMELHINDYFFVSGGITNENPVLLVDLFDLHGINVTGASIGHDLIAILDNNVGSPVNLNNYYNTKNDYTTGVARYQFTGLSEGEHKIMVKAWDSYNNMTTKEIYFRVVNSESIVVENLYAYPNPMSSYTKFVFEHNHSGDEMDITIQIFDMMGKLIKEIKETTTSTGFRTEPIIWDGTVNGNYVNNGLYLYRARIKFQDGTLQQKSNKLLIMR